MEARTWLEAHVPRPPLPSMDTAEGFQAHREGERTLNEGRWRRPRSLDSRLIQEKLKEQFKRKTVEKIHRLDFLT